MFAILLEAFEQKFKRNSITLLVGRGGLRGTNSVNKHFVNKLAFPICELFLAIVTGSVTA